MQRPNPEAFTLSDILIREELSRALIANLPGGAAFVVDRNLRYFLAEGEALSAAGFKPEDFVGKTIFEVLPPDLAASYEPLYRRALAGEPFEHEHNAHDRWYISRGTPLRSPEGEVYAVLAVSYDITERKRAEVVIRESETKYRSLFDSINEGFCIVELIDDDAGRAVDYRFLEVNPIFEHLTGIKNVRGKTNKELNINTESHWLENYDRVARTGEPLRLENYHEATKHWYQAYVSRVGGEGSRQIAIVFDDITDRKHAEESLRESEKQQAFLLKFSDALRAEPDADAVANRAIRMLADHLRLDRFWLSQVFEQQGISTVGPEYRRPDLPPMSGVFRLSDYPATMRQLVTQPMVIHDVANDPRFSDSEKALLDQLHLRSLLVVPLRKGQHQVIWAMAAAMSRPRHWNESERVLLEQVGERTWAAIERARAGTALQQSEAKYRSLFQSIDAGFCVIEVLFNERGTATDYRFLEANSAFEQQTGLVNVIGKTVRELAPQHEAYWFELYGRIALTGIPERFENAAQDLERFYDVYAFRIGEPQERKVAILFNDITDRKQAEQELIKTNQLLQATFDNSLQDIQLFKAVRDERGDIADFEWLLTNKQWNDQWGEMAGKRLLTENPAVVETGLFEMFKQVTESGVPIRHECHYAYEQFDGWFWQTIAQVEDGFLLSTIDITDRKRAEETLRGSEEKYRSLFTSIDEGFTLLEMIPDESGHPADFRIVETNPAWEQQTGLTDAVGKTLLEVVPNFEQQLLDFYSDVVISGRGRRTEYYTASVDRWYTVYASPIGGEGSRQVVVVFNDISDRKRAENQLRDSAEQQQFLLNFSDTLRVLPDKETIESTSLQILAKYLHLDRVYIAAVYSSDDRAVIGPEYYRPDLMPMAGELPLSDFPEAFRIVEEQTLVVNNIADHPTLSDLDRQSFAAIDLTALVVASARRGERNVIWSVLAAMTTPRNWTAGEVALLETVAERTWAAIERANAEAALRESELQRVREQSEREQERQRAESLAELDRTKTAFFSNVSHEFRTPLTLSLAPLQDALKSVDEWMSGSVDENPSTHQPINSSTLKHNLELVHRNSLRLLKLVNTLLDFSRIEAGRMEAVYEPTDLAAYTAELTSVFRSAIERAGLQLVVDCSSLPEPVFVDREMWEKIVLNLLSNAFKFTLEGEIRVSLDSTDRHQAILQVQDTGTGIAPEHLPHLFERFYQVRGTQARTHDGSGIGLALVHELVRLQGGTIEVSSNLGEGTCFTIALPFGIDHLPHDRLHLEGDRQPVRTLTSTAMGATVYVEEAERWLPEENGEEAFIPTPYSLLPTPPSARVLVVDDNADMREYLTRILSEHVQVEAVADGATALAATQEQVPDLILSDVMMPRLDGFELLEALRSNPRTREVPIILLSARAGEGAIVEGLEAGADDYLIKPFSAQELVSRVTAHLQMAQLRGEALQQERIMNHQKDEFISVVSHELNTPLVSILGWTRMLRSSPPNPAMLSKALDTIERNATLQGKLVQDLLDLSRISAGKLRLNPQPIELRPVIEAAIATVTQPAADKGIHLTWQENVTEPVVVMGDGDRLGQVICNLLTNAIKFTPESGSVTLELLVMNNGGSADACYAEIRVADTGIGMAADFLPHVFERFRQAEGAHSAKGLGLGLAIARHIVELHNGTIQAESAGEGQGTTFSVRLPLLQKSDDFSAIQPRI